RRAAGSQVLWPDPEPFQVFLRQVDAPAPRVALEVAQDVYELQRRSEVHRVLAGLGIAVSENLDRDQADGACHAVTIHGEVVERGVARAAEVHLQAQDQVVKISPGYLVTLNGLGQSADFRRGTVAVGAPRVATVQRLAIPGDFAGGLIGPQVAVRQVVAAARKRVHRLDGAPFFAGKKQEGVVEVRSSGSGE